MWSKPTERESKHSPRSRPQVCSHGRLGRPLTVRQTSSNKEIYPQGGLVREKWNSVCIPLYNGRIHGQLHAQRERERERKVTNRQCTICDHCLSCQIALLLASDYLCYRTPWWVFSLENIGEEEKREQITALLPCWLCVMTWPSQETYSTVWHIRPEGLDHFETRKGEAD